ncbi:Activator of Hsp90 ATPase homolog 1-like protein [Nocardia otitidiscaviarum]|uniref:Activator of Hsp90 ATPase homolog 1-like protein n=1 Tax=Nocardia otitidiscaviarum TaxID=1823 RepID=A0A378Y7H4_9NOCA|nr:MULTISPECIES: SRPBCC domain-containing protein [Nocardia]MBF6178197.1 SRPBCC domain-containing protein [Nocardia otitidiscaviarum]MBF6238395.1 SRPBCC domain-containing protein [Nocardia otitidiscaviarum]MCP9623167.1 SRPBCC domain-containing protein [Nocardia otitidiscaviarum]QDP77821.1 SRPBCC domain-containing protein [Nocardia otitidiscaviarum]SUA73172.1 Activator of Hsp90 ATPase homolog 1-like protein [Nocardia otitidiscaviarum]
MMSDPELNPAAVEIGSFFPQPPDTVWHALTDPDLLEQWLLRSVGFAPAVGTHFIFSLPTRPPGEIACEVLTAEPATRLTFRWIDLRADYPARWIVDWTIHPQGRGTRLLLTQTGFDIEDRRQKMARNAMERGWKGTLSRLRELLDR